MLFNIPLASITTGGRGEEGHLDLVFRVITLTLLIILPSLSSGWSQSLY